MIALLAVSAFSVMGNETMSAQAAKASATLNARERLQHVAQVVRHLPRSAAAIRTSAANEALLGIPARFVERISPREFYYGMPGPDRKLEYEVHLSCASDVMCGRFTLAINIVPPTDLRIADLERMFGRRLYPSPNLRELAHASEILAPGSGAGTYESVERGSHDGLAHIRVELGVDGLVSNVAVEGR